MSNRLFVGNLSFHTTEDMLAQTFQQYGEVSEVKLILDRETGRSRGFAFVTMKSDEDAQKATQNLDGAMLDGRTLRVNEAEDRRPRPSFGGGGGGPGGGGGGFRGGGGGGGGGGGYRGGGGGGGGGGFGGGGGGGDRRGGGRGGRGGDERRGGRDRDRGNRW